MAHGKLRAWGEDSPTVADLDAPLDDGRALPILLPENEVAEVGQRYALDIHANAGDLVYATVRKSVTNENDSVSDTSSPG